MRCVLSYRDLRGISRRAYREGAGNLFAVLMPVLILCLFLPLISLYCRSVTSLPLPHVDRVSGLGGFYYQSKVPLPLSPRCLYKQRLLLSPSSLCFYLQPTSSSFLALSRTGTCQLLSLRLKPTGDLRAIFSLHLHLGLLQLSNSPVRLSLRNYSRSISDPQNRTTIAAKIPPCFTSTPSHTTITANNCTSNQQNDRQHSHSRW